MVADFPLSEAGRNLMLANLGGDTEEFIEGMDKWVSTKAIDYLDNSGRRYGVTAFFFEDTTKPGEFNARPPVVDVLAGTDASN